MGVLISLLALLAALVGLASYPIAAPAVGLGLLIYGAVLWRWPSLWLFVVPASLPVLDLSQYTGRLLLDEFDLVVLISLAVVSVRARGNKTGPWPHPLIGAAFGLLWLTWGVATARGLWPLISTHGEFSVSSHSPLEAWIVGKGLLWALLLVPLLRRVPSDALEAASRRVLSGLVTGLSIVTLAVIWERHVYVGLQDFESVFRVTGTFSSMHTGGAYIEAFIAFAFPALVVWVLMQRNQLLKVSGVMAAALTAYAMLVTFSRGGYAGLVAGFLIVVLGALQPRFGWHSRPRVLLVGLAAAIIAVAVPVLSGEFAQYRLARVAEDLSIRQSHWQRALGLMDGGLAPKLVGMGFGQYPIHYLLRANTQSSPGTYRVVREEGNAYLRIGAGEPTFLDQIVDVRPGTDYVLSARLRQPGGEASLKVWLCEKALLYSFACVSSLMDSKTAGNRWSEARVSIKARELGGGGNWPHRSLKLSLQNPSRHPVDVDDVSLKAQGERELVANGGFEHGVERWLFVSDQDLAWHIHQQWVETYFAQGWLGVLALVTLLAGLAGTLGPAVLAGNLQATAFGAALVAFLTVGLLGSTADTARLAMLFYFGAFCAGLLSTHDRAWVSRRGHAPV